MRLVENIPLDTGVIAHLITDYADLHLVWPSARWPFDHLQWEKVLNPASGNKSFLVYEGSVLIGHAALCRTEQPEVYSLNYLYLTPQMRSRGLGEKMVGLLEQYAREQLSAKKLVLVTRTYNPRARKCYSKCGFREYSREATLIRMSKVLQPEQGLEE
ncbi:MAG: GNAT family N-acetyltransferase [Deltaproteobacteria bacterium]|nr:GNAT family N-acetyltransferase [Deltaproteobacteria bacterium]